MGLSINFDDHDDVVSFIPVPEGIYSLQCTKCSVEMAKNKPDAVPYFKLEMTVASPDKYKGRNINVILSFSQSTLKFIKNYLKVAGKSVTGRQELESSDFYGTKVNAIVTVLSQEVDGKVYNNNNIKPWDFLPYNEGTTFSTEAVPSPTGPILPKVTNKMGI